MRPVSQQKMGEEEFRVYWLARLAEATAAERIPHAAVARELGVGNDVYSKWRKGLRRLSSWNFVRLSKRFGLPLTPDEIDTNRIYLDAPFSTADGSTGRVKQYVGVLRRLVQSHHDPAVQARMLVSSTDVPVPYFFSYPVLRSIKLYFFAAGEPSFGWPSLSDFRQKGIDAPILAAVGAAFASTPRVEIWGTSPLDSFRTQINHLRSVGAVEEVAYRQAQSELAQFISHLQNQLLHPTGRFSLHLDGTSSRSPRYVIEAGRHSKAVVTDDPPYFNVTDDAKALKAMRVAFTNRLRSAKSVTQHGQLSVQQFIDSLRE